MNTWDKLISLLDKAVKQGFFAQYQPFRDGNKVGHNSHYRFVWLYSWWKALFGEEASGVDFVLKNPTQARLEAHKALEVALDKGPNAMIEFMWDQFNGDES